MTFVGLSLNTFETVTSGSTTYAGIEPNIQLTTNNTIDKIYDSTKMVDRQSNNHIMQKQPGSSNDQEVIAKITYKDKSAFNDLYNRYSQLVYNLAYRILNDKEDAEEAVQVTFLQIWNNATSYRSDRGAVSTWIINIARSRSIDKLRTLKRRNKNTELDEEKVISASDPADAIVQLDERKEVLQKAIQNLPKKQRIALEMVYFEGYTHVEAAEKLNEPVGTVKTRIRLGVSKLRATILPYLKESIE